MIFIHLILKYVICFSEFFSTFMLKNESEKIK